MIKVGKLIDYNLETKNLNSGALFNKPVFKVFIDTVDDSDYEDLTIGSDALLNIDKYGKEVLQYIQVRNVLYVILITTIGSNFAGWSGLSAEKKLIAARWILAPYSLRSTILTEEEDIDCFRTLLEETAGTRKETLVGRRRIIEEMRQVIGIKLFRTEVISKADVDDMYATCRNYITDFVDSNAVTFKQWLTSATGTQFENNGYMQKSYFSQTVLNELMVIYAGIY